MPAKTLRLPHPTLGNLKVAQAPGPQPPSVQPLPKDVVNCHHMIIDMQKRILAAEGAMNQYRIAMGENKRVYEAMRDDRRKIASYLAAILVMNGRTMFVPCELRDQMVMLFERGEVAGFDFDEVGPDAIGPRRARIRVLSAAERQAEDQHIANLAGQGVVGASPAPDTPARPAQPKVAAEPEAQPCPHRWHHDARAHGDACPKCGNKFPRKVSFGAA